MKSIEDYRELLPLALDWVLGVEKHCLENGRVLNEKEIADARSVGAQKPEAIRILMVQSIAAPEHPALLQAAKETGLLGDTAAARTMGYGIEVVNGFDTRRLLRHEFRHVYQLEQAGSQELFINAYVESVIANGYYDSVFEQDARAYEDPLLVPR